MSTGEFVTIACTLAGAVAGASVQSLMDHVLTRHDLARMGKPSARVPDIDNRRRDAELAEAHEENARLRTRIADLERMLTGDDGTARPDAA